jgi:thiol-disulfide isomerase/thioredoxin
MDDKSSKPGAVPFWGWAAIMAALAVTFAGFLWMKPSVTSVPQVTFNMVEGEPLSSAHLPGRLTLINFWSTTCGVCLQEMPYLVQTYRDYHERGFDIVAVAMPYDRPDVVLDYRQRKQLPFKVAIDYDGKINQAFGGVGFTPTSVLIDAHGKIINWIVGAPDFKELRSVIEKELGTVAKG